jgi:putative restriction endonuclease
MLQRPQRTDLLRFYTRAGQPISLPERPGDRPHRDFLEWHLDEVYKAA